MRIRVILEQKVTWRMSNEVGDIKTKFRAIKREYSAVHHKDRDTLLLRR
jgi:hypothetical protein